MGSKGIDWRVLCEVLVVLGINIINLYELWERVERLSEGGLQ